MNENHPLYNQTLHISEAFKKTEKPDIDILKADIEKVFQPKTVSNILQLYEKFSDQTIFGRSDVMKVIGIRTSRASEFLRELTKHGIIEPVSGHGKGKYRVRLQ